LVERRFVDYRRHKINYYENTQQENKKRYQLSQESQNKKLMGKAKEFKRELEEAKSKGN